MIINGNDWLAPDEPTARALTRKAKKPTQPRTFAKFAPVGFAAALTLGIGLWLTAKPDSISSTARPAQAQTGGAQEKPAATKAQALEVSPAKARPQQRAQTAPSAASPAIPAATARSTDAETAAPADSETTSESPNNEAALSEFDRLSAYRAVERAAWKAQSCKFKGEPRGEADVVVRFAPSGHVEYARVMNDMFAGTLTADCIESKMRAVSVAAFAGEPALLGTRVKLR